MSDYSVTCKVCLKTAELSVCMSVGMGVCMCGGVYVWVCVWELGVVGCEGVSVGVH